jgi:hypothetical protein
MLKIEARLDRPDDFYQALIDTHRDLSPDESALVNCKLILLLANHIGDFDVLTEAMRRARAGVHPSSTNISGSEP